MTGHKMLTTSVGDISLTVSKQDYSRTTWLICTKTCWRHEASAKQENVLNYTWQKALALEDICALGVPVWKQDYMKIIATPNRG